MDFSKKEIDLLIDLLDFEPEDNFNYESVADYLELNSSDARFIKIKKWLKEKKVLVEKEKFGNSMLLEFNYKNLKENIPEIDWLKVRIFGKLVKEHWNKEIFIFK